MYKHGGRETLPDCLRAFLLFGFFIWSFSGRTAAAQIAFDVASIHPSGQEVKFERNGKTEAAHGTLTMRDVTVSTCIQWAYGKPQPLISGSSSLKNIHYDITAKADPGTSTEAMRMMLRTLLADRFKLAYHLEKKELRVYSLNVAKSGVKMQRSGPGEEMSHENSAIGMTGHAMTMHELADYLSDPLGAPLTDDTTLKERYDLKIDFTPYVDLEHTGERPDPVAVMKAALKGELGLELVQHREVVEVLVVDSVSSPTSN
jgi:uncharacterized protein (TIGR03435 family)